MTIYTSKPTEKKEDADFIPPEVVDYDYVPLAKQVSVDNVIIQRRRRRMGGLHVCLALIILPLALCLLTGCIWLFKRLNHRSNDQQEPRFLGRCGVHFHQFAQPDFPIARSGHFESNFELTRLYEVISFPQFGNVSKSITVHDYKRNITVVADEGKGVCYYMPLNRSHVFMPQNVWEALKEIKTMKLEAELNMDNYNMVEPAITMDKKKEMGELMMKYCSELDTYKLEPESHKDIKGLFMEKLFNNIKKNHNKKHNNNKDNNNKDNIIYNNNKNLKKRSVCNMKGLQYCESATQQHHLYCFNIANCL